VNVTHELLAAPPSLLSVFAWVPGAAAGAAARILLVRPGNPLGSRLPTAKPTLRSNWIWELLLAGILGASVAVPLVAIRDSGWIAGGVGAGLATCAAASGAIAFINSREQRSNPVGPSIAHFFGAGAASTVGLLAVVAAMRL
jgi:hypothetical protein